MSEKIITSFVVVRHGQTKANLTRIIQGQGDWPLDERGMAQARAVAEHLKEEHFDHVISSDLSRAMVTAREICRFHPGLEVVPDPALREWCAGELEGQSLAKLEKERPDLLHAFYLEDDISRIPGAETRDVFFARVSACLDRLAAEYAGKRLLLVAHGGVLKAIFSKTVGPVLSGNLMPFTDNASVSEFDCNNGRWQLKKWNENSHLRATGKSNLFAF